MVGVETDGKSPPLGTILDLTRHSVFVAASRYISDRWIIPLWLPFVPNGENS